MFTRFISGIIIAIIFVLVVGLILHILSKLYEIQETLDSIRTLLKNKY